MTLNQNVQKEAQAELDAIIGKDGMPRARDREDLPYVGALVKEVLRYEPPLPYGQYPISMDYFNSTSFTQPSHIV